MLIGDAESSVRRRAATLLGDLAMENMDADLRALADETLIRLTVIDDDGGVRGAAATSLGKYRIPIIIARLLDDLRSHTAAKRAQAAGILKQFSEPRVIAALKTAFTEEKDKIVRLEIARSLIGAEGDPAMGTFLIKALKDKDPDVRLAAVNALGGAKMPAAWIPAIFRELQPLLEDNSRMVQLTTRMTLGKLGVEKSRTADGAEAVSDDTVFTDRDAQIGRQYGVVSVQDMGAVLTVAATDGRRGRPEEFALPVISRSRMPDEKAIVAAAAVHLQGLVKNIVGVLPAGVLFAVYDEPRGDLFGFAWPAGGIIAVYTELADSPVAQFHEIVEYAAQLRPEILAALESSLDVSARAWLLTHERKYARLGKTGDFTERKAHYIIRAFSRQAFGLQDSALSERIRRLALLTGATDEDLQFTVSYLQDLNGLLLGLSDPDTNTRQRSARALSELLGAGFIGKNDLGYRDIVKKIIDGINGSDLEVSEICAGMLEHLVERQLIDQRDLQGQVSLARFVGLLDDPRPFFRARSAAVLRSLSLSQTLSDDHYTYLSRNIPFDALVAGAADAGGGRVLNADALKSLVEGGLVDPVEIRKKLAVSAFLDQLQNLSDDSVSAAGACVLLLDAGVFTEEDAGALSRSWMRSKAIDGLDGSLGRLSKNGAEICKVFLQAHIISPADISGGEILPALIRGIRDTSSGMLQANAEIIGLLCARGMISGNQIRSVIDPAEITRRWPFAGELERGALVLLLKEYPAAVPAERAAMQRFVDVLIEDLGRAGGGRQETAAQAVALISKPGLLDPDDTRVNELSTRLASLLGSRNGTVRLNGARALAALVNNGILDENGKRRLHLPFDQILAGLDDPGYAYLRVVSAQVLSTLADIGLCLRKVSIAGLYDNMDTPLLNDSKRVQILKGMCLLRGEVAPKDVDALQELIQKTDPATPLFKEMLDLMRWFSLNRSSKAQDLLDRHLRGVLNRGKSADGYIALDARDRAYIDAAGKSYGQASLLPFVYRQDLPADIRGAVLKSLADRGTIDAEYARVPPGERNAVLKIIANVHNELGIIPPYQLTHMILLGEITPQAIRREISRLSAVSAAKDYRTLIGSLARDAKLLLAYYCLRQAPFTYQGTVTISFQRFEEIVKKADISLQSEDADVVRTTLKEAFAKAGLSTAHADAVTSALLAGRPPFPDGSPYLDDAGAFVPQPVGSVIIPENASVLKYAEKFRLGFLSLTDLLKTNQLIAGIRKGIASKNVVSDPQTREQRAAELDQIVTVYVSGAQIRLPDVYARLMELHGKIYTRPAKPAEQLLTDGVRRAVKKTVAQGPVYRKLYSDEQEYTVGVPDIGRLASELGDRGGEELSLFLRLLGEKTGITGNPSLLKEYNRAADDILKNYRAYCVAAHEQDLIVDVPQVVYLDYVNKNNIFEALRFSDGAHSCNTSDPKTLKKGGYGGGDIYETHAHRWLTDATTFFFQVTTRPREGKQVGWIKCWFGLDEKGTPFVGSNYLYLSPAYKDKRLVKAVLKKIEEVMFSLPIGMFAQYGPDLVAGVNEFEMSSNAVKPPESYEERNLPLFTRLQSLKDGTPMHDDLSVAGNLPHENYLFKVAENTPVARRAAFEKTAGGAAPAARTIRVFGNPFDVPEDALTHIRPGKPADAVAIRDLSDLIYRPGHEYRLTVAGVTDLLSGRAGDHRPYILVYEKGGEIRGYIYGQIREREADVDVYISQIAVAQEAQGGGIGKGLMALFLKDMEEMGARSVALRAASDKSADLALSFGFQKRDLGGSWPEKFTSKVGEYRLNPVEGPPAVIRPMPQMGKRVSVVEIAGGRALVKDRHGTAYDVPLRKAGPVDFSALRAYIEPLDITDQGLKDSALLMADSHVFEKSVPDLYVYEVAASDLFGFASVQHRLVALQAQLSAHPIALFHELAEYLVEAGIIDLSFDAGSLVVRFATGRRSVVPLSPEPLEIAVKWPDNPHYLIRALTRELFGARDRQLTLAIKMLQDIDLIRRRAKAAPDAIRSLQMLDDPDVDVPLAQGAVDLMRELQYGDEDDFSKMLKLQAINVLQQVAVAPGSRPEIVRYVMEQFFMRLLADGSPETRGRIAKFMGDIVYENTDLITPARFEDICRVLATTADAGLKEQIFSHLLEPLFFKRPDLCDGPMFTRLAGLYADQPELFKYLTFYAQMRGMKVPAGMQGAFEHQQAFKELVLTGPKRVLIVHNIDDGLGDEIIRNSTLCEAMLAANKDLTIHLYTARPFLYKHPRVQVKDLSELRLSDEERFDMVVDYFSAQGYCSAEAGDRLFRYLSEDRFPPVYIRGGAMMWDFNYQTIVLGDEAVYMPSYRMGNCYVPAFRLCAELGLPFRAGLEKPREPLLLPGGIDPAAKRYWEQQVAARAAGRPVVVMNGFGGEMQVKGFVNTDAGRRSFAAALQDLLARKVCVVLLPNDTEWGSTAVLEQVVSLLSPEDQKDVFIAPTLKENRQLHNYAVLRADLVVTVEGGMMHVAYNLGKPLVVARVIASSAFNEWVPAGTDPCQLTVTGPELIGAGAARVLDGVRDRRMMTAAAILKIKAMALKDRLAAAVRDAGSGPGARRAAGALLGAITTGEPACIRSAFWSLFMPVPAKGEYTQDVIGLIEYLTNHDVPLGSILPVVYDALIKVEEIKEQGFGLSYAAMPPRDKHDLNAAALGAAALFRPENAGKNELFLWHIDPETGDLKCEMELKEQIAAAKQLAARKLRKRVVIGLEETDAAKIAIVERMVSQLDENARQKIVVVKAGKGEDLIGKVKRELVDLKAYTVIGANVPVDTIGEYRDVIDFNRLSVLILAVQGNLTIVNIPEFVQALSTKELAVVIEEFKKGGLPQVRDCEMKMDDILTAYEAIGLSA